MKSSITSMKPKDANKLDIAELDKSETYPEENQPREHRGDREKRANESIWSEIRHKLNRIAEQQGNRILSYLQDGEDRAFSREKLTHVSEDTQVYPQWVSKWK